MEYFQVDEENFRVKFCSSEIGTESSQDDLHDFYEMDFFIKANLQIFIKDLKYEIHDGDLFFINAHELHHIFYNKTDQYVRTVILFKAAFVADVLKALNLEYLLEDIAKADCRKISVSLKHIEAFEALFRSLTKKDSIFSEQKSRLDLVLILIKYYEELSKSHSEKVSPTKNSQIAQIVEFLYSNYKNAINLDFLEKKFFLSKFYISHIFKDKTGFSVMQYIQYRRVVEAQNLLKYTDRNIDDICYDCGFNNIQDFYRVFKKISGITPSRFRKFSIKQLQ